MTFDQPRAHRKPYADIICMGTLQATTDVMIATWWLELVPRKKGRKL